MASNTTKEVLFDLSPVLKVYTDGTVERLMGTPNVPPSPEDPTTGVASKDIIVISPEVKARLFLPKLADPNHKLPVLVYYHGGGFIVDSPYCLNFHRYMNILAAEAKALIISVEYRLAPEHLLPIAYEDSWTAIQWVASHVIANASIEKDPWVTKHGDFGNLYIGGDSAGANIAHNIVLRAGVEPLPGDVKVLGLFLSCPYFWGSKPVGSQSKNDLKGFAYQVWMCVYPSAAGGIDNPMINPFAEDAPSLSGLACSRLLVCLAGKDAFTPRGILYVETVKKSGWNGEVQLVVVDGEDHEFHVNDPYTEKAKDLIQKLASFISNCNGVSWTQANSEKRFLTCTQSLQNGGSGYFSWCDPPMYRRFVDIMPGLLKSRNAHEKQVLELQRQNGAFGFRSWVFGFVCGCVMMWIFGGKQSFSTLVM